MFVREGDGEVEVIFVVVFGGGRFGGFCVLWIRCGRGGVIAWCVMLELEL